MYVASSTLVEYIINIIVVIVKLKSALINYYDLTILKYVNYKYVHDELLFMY
jgi:hypothetical protein